MPVLEQVENESESTRCKDIQCPRNNVFWTNEKQYKSQIVTKTIAGSSIVFCHLPRWQSQTSESLARCHVRFLLVPSSGAARPSHTPIFHPPFCPTANAASMGLPADLDHAPYLDELGQADITIHHHEELCDLDRPHLDEPPKQQPLHLSPLPLGQSLPRLVITCRHHHHHCDWSSFFLLILPPQTFLSLSLKVSLFSSNAPELHLLSYLPSKFPAVEFQ